MSLRAVRMDLAPGMCSPVVISAILSVAAVWIAYNGKDAADKAGVVHKDSMGVQQVALGGLMTTAFLWALCYYKYEGAAWFFLLAPMVIAGFEVAAILNMFRDVVDRSHDSKPSGLQ